MIKLDNGIISLSVEERGAQMRSLCDVESGREYLWQADSEIWGRTAPVLFPAVGAVHTEGYIYKDKRYPMPKHGFARDFDFEPVEKTPQSLVLALYPNDKIKQMYPFDFVFRARFALSGRTLSFSYEAENIGTETMYFSLGAHPGFACAFSDRIVFEKREPTAALFCGADDRPNKSAAPLGTAKSLGCFASRMGMESLEGNARKAIFAPFWKSERAQRISCIKNGE